ncbi:hypothetical protein [Chengkuizengella axinellae]|uniref:Uncharacterized protein n=1 Tax=Chengkuizengella axinellae TaxID=3064388 RepID=A0ABT9J2V4_9BACL|nr:hypothetical protein [Chengkuizengella sp. 2205SS18-9]MDP5275777.1 hypothetical protein [Chengkuizengella sp. 2205SS18-9]
MEFLFYLWIFALLFFILAIIIEIRITTKNTRSPFDAKKKKKSKKHDIEP